MNLLKIGRCSSSLWQQSISHQITTLTTNNLFLSTHPTSRNFSTTSPGKVSKLKILKGTLKQYGVPFLIVESAMWAVSVGAFYVLLSNGLQISDVLLHVSRFVDVDYWVGFWGIDKSLLTGTGSKIAISLLAAEIITPLRLPLDLLLLLQLKRYNVIRGPKEECVEPDCAVTSVEK